MIEAENALRNALFLCVFHLLLMIKIGVLGVGYLGKVHLRCLQQIPGFDVIGFFDPDPVKQIEANREFGLRAFPSAESLILEAEAIDIVTSTIAHHQCAKDVLKNSKHLFIEKPITYSAEDAQELIKLTHEANVTVQVGHVERFNPAFQAILPHINNPQFIESHRIGPFNPRGLDVPVVLDLMIHDIDIALTLIKSPVKRIFANGVKILSDSADIANARIEFSNGSVANLTSSRISMHRMRKTRIFQKDAYLSVDFLNKKAEIYGLGSPVVTDNPFTIFEIPLDEKGSQRVRIETPVIRESNAILEELKAFHHSIVNKTPPVVSIEDGYYAVELAQQILSQIRKDA